MAKQRRYFFSLLSGFGHTILVVLGLVGLVWLVGLYLTRSEEARASFSGFFPYVLIVLQFVFGVTTYLGFESVRYKVARQPARTNKAWQNGVGSVIANLGLVWWGLGFFVGGVGFLASLLSESSVVSPVVFYEFFLGGVTGGYAMESLGDMLKAQSPPEKDPNYDPLDNIV